MKYAYFLTEPTTYYACQNGILVSLYIVDVVSYDAM